MVEVGEAKTLTHPIFCYTLDHIIEMGVFVMRFLIKLILVVALGYVIYHFYGPQIDSMIDKAKATLSNAMKAGPTTPNHDKDSEEQHRQYYPIEKRTQ